MIPVCEPFLSDKELENVVDCLRTNWISSKGKYISEFEEKFSAYCGAKYGITTTSGTTALHLALQSLGIGKGDEVIVPTFTMASTVFAVVYGGAKPVLVDSEPETWNINVEKIEEKITSRARAIMPVHIYGHPVDMNPVLRIAEDHKLYVIEDAAEAHGAEYKGKKVGALGHIGCFSFYANKIITTGEGGMVVTNSPNLAEKARSLKDLAFSREKRFLHTDIGFNYKMTNLHAAIGVAQMERIDELADRRRKNASLYINMLKDMKGITLPVEKEWAKNVYWMFSILVGDEFAMDRDALMQELWNKGIETRTFFIPMHEQPVFQRIGLFAGESYPIAEHLSRKGLYLPSGSGLLEDEIRYICATMLKIQKEATV